MTQKTFLIIFSAVCLQCCLYAADSSNESSPDELFKSGVTAFQAQDYAGAAKNFEAVLALGPTGEALETILFSLAGTYFNQKDLPKAEEYFNRVVKEFPEGKNKTKALISLSQIQSQTGRKEEAAASLQLASQGGGDLALQAKLALASMLVESGKPSDAANVLRPMIEKGIRDDISVQAAMALTEVLAKQGNLDEALKMLDQLQAASNLVSNPLQLDILAVKIGDALLEKGERKEALRMYAIVRPREVIITLQKKRIEDLEGKIASNRTILQTNPKAFLEVNATNSRLQASEDNLKKALAEFENKPDLTTSIRVRQAKAYDELDEKWENILIWESVLEGNDPKIREDALFSIAGSYASLGRTDDAEVALDKYLAEFPIGKYADQAKYLKGAVALESGDYVKAETVFGERIGSGDTSALGAEIQFLLANTQFAQGADPKNPNPAKYRDGLLNYNKYLEKYPDGRFAEESMYRSALCEFQLGDYAKALDSFQAYEKKYPGGTFIGDSGYRIALCYNAANKYDEVLKRCDDWLKNHSGESMQAEVLALKGDAYASKEMTMEAADAYRKSVEMGKTEELLQYSLFKANEQYQKLRQWDDIIDMFNGFATKHPKHPSAVVAVYWVSKAKIKQGKSEEAKQYMAQNILLNINDRWNDSVEKLLSQLAQTCSKRPRPLLIPNASATASENSSSLSATTNTSVTNSAVTAIEHSPTPRPSATPLPLYDAQADFAKYLNAANVGTTPLAQARLRYAQSQLDSFTKHPDGQKELLVSIYSDFTAEQLSALLLALCGDIALEKGKVDKAESFYQELMTSFPKSDLLEYAYYGMGAVELARNKPDSAITWFDDAVEKANADAKLADVTYGKGQALVMLGKFEEAKKIYEQVAATKEWRGEVTAKALLSLGDLEAKRGNTAAAIQYYQRVFVAYQRYPNVVIPAYIKASDGFVKLGSPDKAADHLRELLANPKLAQSPLADDARKKLQALPATTPTPMTNAPSQSEASAQKP
jgi:TolA-binding protein